MRKQSIFLATIGAAALAASIAAREPEPERKRPGKRKRRRRDRITSSTRDRFDTVSESPEQLLAQAHKHVDADVTLDELTGARLIASEWYSAPPVAMAAVVDAELNRAESKRKSLTAHLTSAGTYGKQGGRSKNGKKRPASTRRDPNREHLRVSRAVLNGELRGVSRGAVRFLDPASQWSSHRKWLSGESPRRHCHPAIVLERWAHNKPWDKKGPPCALRDRNGKRLQEWVGPIDGINPLRLMLLRPAKPGEEHQRLYREARRLILKRYPLPKHQDRR